MLVDNAVEDVVNRAWFESAISNVFPKQEFESAISNMFPKQEAHSDGDRCVRQALYSMKKGLQCVCHSIVAVCTGQQYVGKTFSSAQCAVVAAESVSTHYETHVSCKQ